MNRKTIDKLDKLVSEIVRDKGYCEYCKKRFPPNELHPHHFFGRGNLSTRWDLENMFALCPEHHTGSYEFSAHKTPKKFEEWAIKARGKVWYQELAKRVLTPKNYSDKELKQIYEELSEIYR